MKRPHDLVSWCRFILLVLNITALFLGLIFLGSSIFLYVDKANLLTDVMYVKLAEAACIMLMGCSVAAVFFTASNLLGVLGNIKWLIIVNIVIHCIIGLLSLICAVFAIISVVNNTDWMRQAMRESLQQRYGVDVGNNTRNTYETYIWDITQQRWYCCGVENNSWGIYRASSWYDIQPGSKEYDRPLVPVSCCVSNQYGRIINVQKCQIWQNGPPKLPSGIYNEALYYPGCYTFGLTVLNQVSKGIVVMGFIMTFVQLGAVFCSVVVIISMKKTHKAFLPEARSGTIGGGSTIYDPEIEYR